MRRQGGGPGGEPQSKGTLASASLKCAGLCSCSQAGVMEHPSEALESQHLSKQNRHVKTVYLRMLDSYVSHHGSHVLTYMREGLLNSLVL